MKEKPIELHERYNVVKDRPNIHLRYQYMFLTKEWKFVGYRCTACDSGLKHMNAALKHNNNCRELNKELKRSPPNVTVITTTGNVWQPYKNISDGPSL